MTPVLEVRGLSKRFRGGDRSVLAADEVSFDLAAGRTLALVGPSGSGKSTVARLVLGLLRPDAGSVRFAGTDLFGLSGAALRRLRPRLQMVFQDPLAAFNPRATVARVIDDPLRIHAVVPRRERPAAIAGLLARVGLDPALTGRPVHAISGGQRQRVAIARAIASKPDVIVLDEAVSALDVSVRSGILDLLAELQRSEGIAYLFISHDLGVVRSVAHDVAVMDAGRIVETGTPAAVIDAPTSRTARALVAAAPRLRF